jgi:5-methylthioadenosine/S-adenosylhomocysteine deaminase
MVRDDALLLTDADVVTMDADRRRLRRGWVLVDGGVIAAVGSNDERPDLHALGTVERLDLDGQLVLPGFVNCHHHLASTLLRGVAEACAHNTDAPRRARAALSHRAAETRAGVELGYAQLIRSGVTTTVDGQGIWRGTTGVDGSLQAARGSGLRVVFSAAFSDRTELIPSDFHCGPAQACEELDRLQQAYSAGRVEVIPEALSLPRASDALVTALHTADAGRFAMHLTYTPWFDAWARRELGRSTIAHLAALGVLDERFLGAHPIHVDDDELALLAEHGAAAPYCAVSNMTIGSAHLPLRRLREAGVAVGLGLDAPNDGHDFLETMKISAAAQRQAEGDAAALSPDEALELGTIEGARVETSRDGRLDRAGQARRPRHRQRASRAAAAVRQCRTARDERLATRRPPPARRRGVAAARRRAHRLRRGRGRRGRGRRAAPSARRRRGVSR